MNEITRYVEKAFENAPDSQQKAEMMQEIIQRLEDTADTWMQKGKAREDAVNKAIVDFGDLSEVLFELRDGDSKKSRTSKNALLFSIAGSLSIIALMMFINFYYSSQHIWFVYPAFAVIWWPLSIFFFGKWRKGDD